MHTAVISLFCGHQALSCLYESYEHISFACCWATACEWANEFSIVYCFSVKPFLTRQRNYTWGIILLVGSSMLSLPFSSVSLPSFPSLPPSCLNPSIRPPIWLRWGAVGRGRGEQSGAKDGATAGAQSDKERQITPLTRAIHHLFISPFIHPSLPPHLYVRRGAPEKRFDLPHNFTFDNVSHLVATRARKSQSARAPKKMTRGKKKKVEITKRKERGENNKTSEMIEWAMRRERRRKKKRHTHAGTCRDSLPWLLSAQMLDWGGAVSQCVPNYAHICVCARTIVPDSDLRAI